MKLTWFGGTTLRIHIGGSMLVIGAASRPGVDADELVSGADRVLGWDDALPVADAATWQPRRARTMLEEEAPEPVLVHRLGAGQLLVDAVGEPPLLLLAQPLAAAGRWGRTPWSWRSRRVAGGARNARAARGARPAGRRVDALFPELEQRRAAPASSLSPTSRSKSDGGHPTVVCRPAR